MTEYLGTARHDPDAVLDYIFKWETWLTGSETIDSYTITADGVTVDSDSESGGNVTVRISGGTAGTFATVACRITTDAGQVDERTVRLTIGER